MVEQLLIIKNQQFHQEQNSLSDKISLNDDQKKNDEDFLSNKNLLTNQTEMKNENFLDKKRKISSKSINSLLKKFILCIFLAIFIYWIWKKKEIFISRLLTSNSRIRRQINYLIQIDSNDNRFHSTIFVNDDHFNNENNQEIIDENLNDSEMFHQEKNSQNLQRKKEKSILKTRRNKMNFGQESTKKIKNDNHDQIAIDKINSFHHHENQTKKTNKYYQNKDKSKDKDKDKNKKENKTKMKMQKEKKTLSLNNNHHSIEHSIDKDILSQLDNLIEKNKNNEKTNLKSISTKTTDQKRKVLQEIIQKRNYHLLTLDQFLSVLNRYQSTILIISK